MNIIEIVSVNKYERYYGPGRRPPAYLLYYSVYAYGKPRRRLCVNIHQYAPPRIELQQAGAIHAALHALRRLYIAQYREHLIR